MWVNCLCIDMLAGMPVEYHVIANSLEVSMLRAPTGTKNSDILLSLTHAPGLYALLPPQTADGEMTIKGRNQSTRC